MYLLCIYYIYTQSLVSFSSCTMSLASTISSTLSQVRALLSVLPSRGVSGVLTDVGSLVDQFGDEARVYVLHVLLEDFQANGD